MHIFDAWWLGGLFFLCVVIWLAIAVLRKVKAKIDAQHQIEAQPSAPPSSRFATLVMLWGGLTGTLLRVIFLGAEVFAALIGSVAWVVLAFGANVVYSVSWLCLIGPYRWSQKRQRKNAEPS